MVKCRIYDLPKFTVSILLSREDGINYHSDSITQCHADIAKCKETNTPDLNFNAQKTSSCPDCNPCQQPSTYIHIVMVK